MDPPERTLRLPLIFATYFPSIGILPATCLFMRRNDVPCIALADSRALLLIAWRGQFRVAAIMLTWWRTFHRGRAGPAYPSSSATSGHSSQNSVERRCISSSLRHAPRALNHRARWPALRRSGAQEEGGLIWVPPGHPCHRYGGAALCSAPEGLQGRNNPAHAAIHAHVEDGYEGTDVRTRLRVTGGSARGPHSSASLPRMLPGGSSSASDAVAKRTRHVLALLWHTVRRRGHPDFGCKQRWT
ncbi:hypothetical protein OH77DRAFT_274761 [Trametes cingulata]|nr:hypothetical protein OH77DRAFT_274761 [Trametes cingulata]